MDFSGEINHFSQQLFHEQLLGEAIAGRIRRMDE
jgi:hypothetical protein